VVVRLRAGAFIELAGTNQDRAQALLRRIAAEALARSIYRGQFLEIHYQHSPHPDYGYELPAAEMSVTFKARPNVGDADIILDDRIRAILVRNVFDFFTYRECLHAAGVPRKRALLFYGPPGTGKTHTCRYLHSRLTGVTSILVAGESLTRLQDIGKFARQMHPTLIVIEDVDLVFTHRDHNPYGTILGELMDQLDGFTADEEVFFVLTTNAIERVEQAIRDRPGRINQCLFFGLPGPELRRLYLLRYLQPYDSAAVDVEHLVRQTEQASQAFLKEYVLRAVQVGVEAAGYQTNGRLRLETSHFDVAFEELTSHGNPHGHAIMGFRL
jgi:SpoVK/Ycf46/Vps4 family AAA+-type ATPase